MIEDYQNNFKIHFSNAKLTHTKISPALLQVSPGLEEILPLYLPEAGFTCFF
jgi:hypothetical protein